MSCPFYKLESSGWFSSDYYCIKQEKAVDSYTYYKYCRNYDYRDCPIYKHQSSSGGCYLTSACTAARGLPDDCHELQILRRFRDEWLKKQPDGILLIARYYEIAPKIVAVIDALEDKLDVYEGIYQELVLPCVKMIEEDNFQSALALYREYTLRLEEKYCEGE